MGNSARIDELEKKFSENARRYFAPLANEYRKAGDLDRAIEICRAHLPQQPGHMSGHIVYGQALYESRQPDEAKLVFESALALDPENLIALRHLGDIARDGGDIGTARTWYLRVLDADPRNDEVGGMLAELDAMPALPLSASAQAESASGSTGWGDVNPERAAVEDESREDDAVVEAQASGELPDIVPEPDQGAELLDEQPEKQPDEQRDEARAEVAESPEAALLAEGHSHRPPSIDRMLNDVFSPDADTLEMEAPIVDRPRASPETADAPAEKELDEETFAEVDALFDEIAPAHADATSDTPALEGLETREFVPPPRETPPASPRRDTGSMAVTGLTTFDQPTEEDSSTRAAFVTETMAELYLQQGFTAEALEIYRQLVAQNPGDANLRDRVRHLEAGGRSSLSVVAVSAEVIEAAKQRHAARPVRTVRSFFGRLAGRRAPARGTNEEAADDRDSTGESADDSRLAMARRPDSVAPQEIHLDIVGGLFGDAPVSEEDEAAASTLASAFSSAMMGSRHGSADSQPPSAAPRDTPKSAGGRAAHTGGRELSLDQVFREPAGRNPRKSGAYSFDQFFSDGTPGSAGAVPSVPSDRDDSPEAGEGDLEQFTAWLEGLKRK